MQNRYVGDLGDFGKYGLLRFLTKGLKLGIVWYLVPDEGHNADGKFTTYLSPTATNHSRFRDCDPALFDALGKIVNTRTRSVESIRLSGLLPTDTCFFADPLTFQGMASIGPVAKAQRLHHRTRWVHRALETMRDTAIVFVDPDNGIAMGTARHHKKGPKYVYLDEVAPYLHRGQSVVIYQHIHRDGPAIEQIQRQRARIENEVSGAHEVRALLYRRGTARAFFVIAAPAHASLLDERLDGFVAERWSQHFELIPSAP